MKQKRETKEINNNALRDAIVPITSLQRQPQTVSTNPTYSTKPIEIFISYAEPDRKFKNQLETHLAMLRREKVINVWHSEQTTVGKASGREQEIAEHIDSAQIILLLISPSYLASDSLYDDEMMRAIYRQRPGEPVRVISIIVRHVAPSEAPFQKLQCLPSNGKPIETWRDRNKAWAMVVEEIQHMCRELHQNQGP